MKAQTGLASHATPVGLTIAEPASSFDHSVKEIYVQVARRAYELFEQRGHLHGEDHDDWLRAESEMFQPVPIEIKDVDTAFSVQAKVPGFNAKQLDVRVEPTRVVIRGNAQNAQQEFAQARRKTTHSKSQVNEIFRVVYLPGEIDAQQATASLSDGILHLTLLKSAKADNRLEAKSAA